MLNRLYYIICMYLCHETTKTTASPLKASVVSTMLLHFKEQTISEFKSVKCY